ALVVSYLRKCGFNMADIRQIGFYPPIWALVGSDHSLTKNIAIAAYGRLSKRTPPKKAGFVSNLSQSKLALFGNATNQ
ncbi:hypothetical protein, partial [Salinivibrio siamensis]